MNNEIGTEIIANKDNKNIPQIKGDNKYHKKNKPTKNRNIDIGIDKIRHCSHCLIVRWTQDCFLKKNAIIKNDINKKINIVEKIQINASVAQRANAALGIPKRSKQSKIFFEKVDIRKELENYFMILWEI